jgi:hypothetical protein
MTVLMTVMVTYAKNIEEHRKHCVACTIVGGLVVILSMLSALSVFSFDMRPRVRLVTISVVLSTAMYFFFVFDNIIVIGSIACGMCGSQQAPI